MNIYQIYYTRKGTQELGAGWQVTASSEDVVPEMINYYSGMRSNETSLVSKCRQNRIELPEYALELERDGYYAYYTYSSYQVQGADMRGTLFFHGLVFYIQDFFELCKHPEHICGLGTGVFVSGSDAKAGKEGKLSDISEIFPDYHFDFSDILNKYHFSEELYNELMLAIYWKIFHPEANFCICVGANENSLEQCCREIMYIIYMGLPWQFRIRLSFSSCLGYQGKIYFSRNASDEAGFELGVGVWGMDLSHSREYPYQEQLTQIVWDGLGACDIFSRITEICREGWGNNLNAVGNQEMQMVCDSIFGKVPDGRLSEKLDQVLSLKAKQFDAFNDYTAWLIRQMCTQEIEFKETQIRKLYEKIRVQKGGQLKNCYARLFVLQYCKESSTENYRQLHQLRTTDENQYWRSIHFLESRDGTFLLDYFRDYVCKECLTDLEQMKNYTQRFQKAYTDHHFASIWAQKLCTLFKKSCRGAEENKEKEKLLKEYEEYLNTCEEEGLSSAEEIQKDLHAVFWASFSLEDFRFHDREMYRKWGLEQDKAVCKEAEDLAEQIRMEERLMRKFSASLFREIFILSTRYPDKKVREILLADFRSAYQQQYIGAEDPTAMLMLFYSPVTGNISSNLWFSWAAACCRHRSIVSGWENSWQDLLNAGSEMQIFFEEIDRFIKKSRKNKNKLLMNDLERIRKIAMTKSRGPKEEKGESANRIYQKMFLIVACLLTETAAAAVLCRYLNISSVVLLAGILIWNLVISTLTLGLFMREEKSEKFSIVFHCLLVLAAGIVLFFAVSMVDSTAVIFAALISAVVLLAIRFLIYFR